MTKSGSRILATGSYLPEKIITNYDLEKIVETSDEWIRTRTGIRERRVAADDEYTSTMGSQAARKAIAAANMKPDEIEVVIVCTVSPDFIFPATACVLANNIGIPTPAAFDLEAACSGYVYGLGVAKGMVESGMFKRILIVGADKLSGMVDWKDRNTCILFGDGAGAAIVGPGDGSESGLYSFDLGGDGAHGDILGVKAGGCRLPATEATIREGAQFMYMNGPETFKLAVKKFQGSINAVLEKEQLRAEDIDFFIPHQANIRIIEFLAKSLNVSMEKFVINLDRVGNTSAASIAIAMDEAIHDKRIRQGDKVIISGFGGGITWGTALLIA